jgi:DNA-binding MarR family transcriptional regulator
MENPSYYAIIPSNVRYDNALCANAKLLYAEITALSNAKGYCYASNSYFATLYNVKPVSISRWVSQLAKAGYIRSEIDEANGNTRHIYLAEPIIKKDDTLLSQKIRGHIKKDNTPIIKNDNHNNTRENNKDNNINSALVESYAKLQAWMQQDTPKLLRMSEPLTVEQYGKLLDSFSKKELMDIFMEMDNWAKINTKSSVYKTALVWLKRAAERKLTEAKPEKKVYKNHYGFDVSRFAP